MKTLILIVGIILFFSGCSSQEKRTKYSDPAMRILISPIGIDASAYVRIQNAFMRSNKWFVVDRGLAFNAAIEEQDLTRINFPTRFDDREKYARLGKMYSVGGIIQANIQCQNSFGFFGLPKVSCVENLVLINASTGELVASSETEVEAKYSPWSGQKYQASPDWSEVVEKLNENAPKVFTKIPYTKNMEEFRDIVQEESQRQKEEAK